MPSRNKLKTKRLTTNSPRDTYEDDDKYEGNHILPRAIALTAIGIGTYGAYKKGLLKPVIKKGLETYAEIMSTNMDKTHETLRQIKEWTKLKGDFSTSIDMSKSLFRGNNIDSLKEALKSINNTKGVGEASILAKDIIDTTAMDLENLKLVLREIPDNYKKIAKYNDTDLWDTLSQLRKYNNEVKENIASASSRKHAMHLAMDDMLTNPKYVLSHEQELKQLKRNGTRSLMLQDLVEYDVDTGLIKVRENIPLDLETKEGRKFLNDLNRIARGGPKGDYMFSDGTRIVDNWDQFKRTIIDNSLMVTDEGILIDLRTPKAIGKDFINDITREFVIPGLDFNPFASLTSLTDINKKRAKFGLIDVNSYQPGITRMAGQVSVKEALGLEDNLFFIDDKLYGIVDGATELVGDGFKAYNVSNADKYGYSNKIRALFDMASLNPSEIVPNSEAIGKLKNIYENDKIMSKIDKVYDTLHLNKQAHNIYMFNADGERRALRKRDVFFHPFKALDEFKQAAWKKFSPYNDLSNASNPNIFNINLGQAGVNRITKESFDTRKFVMMPKGTDVSDILDSNSFKEGAEKGLTRLKEMVAGNNAGMFSDNFTDKSLGPFSLFDQVITRMGNFLPVLSLNNYDKNNLSEYMYKVMKYRALPIFLGLKSFELINMASEPIFSILGLPVKGAKNLMGEEDDKYNDNKYNITKAATDFIVKPIDVVFHGFKDITGMTGAFKKVNEYLPGFDQINELPYVYQLGLTQSTSERLDYMKNGFDPVRKGRYWSMGNTPYTGGKIEYWRPNLYRRIDADVKFSDSKYGSRSEYFLNMLNPHHYELKHYKDRPYMMTSPIGENVPLIGHTLAALQAPFQRKMHKEYWSHGKPIERNDEQVDIVARSQQYAGYNGYKYVTQGTEKSQIFTRDFVLHEAGTKAIPWQMKQSSSLNIRSLSKDFSPEELNMLAQQANDYMIAKGFVDRKVTDDFFSQRVPLITAQKMVNKQQVSKGRLYSTVPAHSEFNILPEVTDNKFSTYKSSFTYEYDFARTVHEGTPIEEYQRFKLYGTDTGEMKAYSTNPVMLEPSNIVVQEEYTSSREGQVRLAPVRNNYNPQLTDYSNIKFRNRMLYQFGEQFNNTSDFFGMKGYEARRFITGSFNDNVYQAETSSYAYSLNREFWDQSLGGWMGYGNTGEEGSEIFRRFVQKRNTNVNYVNTIRNTMPSWMPGRDYMVDFKHGDAYSQIKNGEERLPGEGYERLYGINMEKAMRMELNASDIGKTKEDMAASILNVNTDIEDKNKITTGKYKNRTVREANELIIKDVEKAWKETGIADVFDNGYIYDKRLGIQSHYNAKISDISSATGVSIATVKPVSNDVFQTVAETGMPIYEHQAEMNFNLYATGNKEGSGYLFYVNRDNPDETLTTKVTYDSNMLNENLDALNSVRNEITKGIQDGSIGRGELYSIIDRYRILADVAPYSNEFKELKSSLSNANLSVSEENEISQIDERVRQQKEPLRIYPYKFQHASQTKNKTVTVKDIIDNNHFTTYEYGDKNIISLAGVKVTQSSEDMYDNETTMKDAANEVLQKYMHPGKRVRISYNNTDNLSVFGSSHISAAVHSNGTNVNKLLVNKGLATEKDDEDPASMRAKYNHNQVAFGSVMETMTHTFAKIPFYGNKWFQVKSPYEQYRDREVYGKDFQSWDHPIKNFLQPEIETQWSKGPIGGTIRGAFIGSLFGGSTYGKIIGSSVGAAVGGTGGFVTSVEEHATGKKWKPERRKRQEEINEYYDMLKYVKNMRLYEQYKKKAFVEDHYSMNHIKDSELEYLNNGARMEDLKNFRKFIKKNYKNRDRYSFSTGQPKYVNINASKGEILKGIDQELNEMKARKGRPGVVPENAVKALYYKNQAEQTVYAYEKGGNLQNMLAALPKKERQYFKYFAEAPKSEQKKILAIAPSYLRRPLQAQYGMRMDEKDSLAEYFSKHGLPDESWIGWDEDVDLQDVKVKLVHHEKEDPGEFDIWRDQEQHAAQRNIPIPNIHATHNKAVVQLKLKQMLGSAGYKDVVIRQQPSILNRNTLVITEDKEDKIKNKLNNMDMFEY